MTGEWRSRQGCGPRCVRPPEDTNHDHIDGLGTSVSIQIQAMAVVPLMCWLLPWRRLLGTVQHGGDTTQCPTCYRNPGLSSWCDHRQGNKATPQAAAQQKAAARTASVVKVMKGFLAPSVCWRSISVPMPLLSQPALPPPASCTGAG